MIFFITLQHLKDSLYAYDAFSKQWVGPSKNQFYIPSSSFVVVRLIKRLLSYAQGSIPFNYLGLPIVVGMLKVKYFQSLVDKIWAKLSS